MSKRGDLYREILAFEMKQSQNLRTVLDIGERYEAALQRIADLPQTFCSSSLAANAAVQIARVALGLQTPSSALPIQESGTDESTATERACSTEKEFVL